LVEDCRRAPGLREKAIQNEGPSMTGDAKRDITLREPLSQRTERLYADDEQFRPAKPNLSLQKAARQPGLRLPQILELFVEAYADRPALGWRARSLTTDPATGRTTAQLLPRFETISYRDLLANVRAVASAWRHDEANPTAPGDLWPVSASPAPST
jgi:fatty acid CoA ligase FadD9